MDSIINFYSVNIFSVKWTDEMYEKMINNLDNIFLSHI